MSSGSDTGRGLPSHLPRRPDAEEAEEESEEEEAKESEEESEAEEDDHDDDDHDRLSDGRSAVAEPISRIRKLRPEGVGRSLGLQLYKAGTG